MFRGERQPGEAILPRPLDPVEEPPDENSPELLTLWSDGSMLVAVRHRSAQHCLKPDLNCSGRIFVPIHSKTKEDKVRFCEVCKKEVIIFALPSIRLEVRIGLNGKPEALLQNR